MAELDSENRSSRVHTVALFLALLGGVSMVYYHLGLFMPRVIAARAAKGLGNGYAFGDDFYPVWLTAGQARSKHIDPYSREMTRQIQTGLFGRPLDTRNPTDPPVDYREFAYPAFTDLLFWPIAAIDFSQLRLILAVLLTLLTAASVWLWVLALDWGISPTLLAILIILALCNYQVLEGLFADQPGLIVGFLLACAALALRRDHLFLSGILLALTLIKPQMTALAIFSLLLWSCSDRRRARLCIGFIFTTLPLVGASLMIWPRWIAEWTRILLGYHRYATPPLLTLLLGPILGAYIGPLVIVIILAVAVVLAWRNRRVNPSSQEFWLTLSLLLAITAVSLLPGQAIYDDVILLPGIFLLLRYRRKLWRGGPVPRTLLFVGAIVLFWPWVAAVALLAARHLLSVARFDSTAVFALPLRTAVSFVFAVLALLAVAARINVAGDQAPS